MEKITKQINITKDGDEQSQSVSNGMNNNLDKIIESAKNAGLRVDEKRYVRESLSQFMEKTSVSSPFWSFTFIRSYHYVPAFLLLFVLLSSGTSYYAQDSLPGETLYSMKINVNETMETFLAVTPAAQAEVFAIQADRRLKEAEILATEGELTEEKNILIVESFSKKVDSLNTGFEKMEEVGEADEAIEILNKFDVQVKNRVSNLSKVPTTTGNTRVANDIVTLIKTRHAEDREEAAASLMMASQAPEAASFSATIAPPENDSSDSSGQELSRKMSTKTVNKIRWTWREDN